MESNKEQAGKERKAENGEIKGKGVRKLVPFAIITLAAGAWTAWMWSDASLPVHPSEREYSPSRIHFYPATRLGSNDDRNYATIVDENNDSIADALVHRGKALYFTGDWTGPKREDAREMSPEMRDDASAVMTKEKDLGKMITQHLYDEHMGGSGEN